MRFFTSDEHNFHNNIIKYCNRPFKNHKEQTSAIIENHNLIVNNDDEVWHIGDFAFGTSVHKIEPVVRKLNGIHHLVLGNHDDMKPFTYVKAGFVSVHTTMPLIIEDYNFVLAHDPAIYTVLSSEQYMLCGHVHQLFKHLLPEKRVINVGVDVWDFAPVSENTILELIRSF